MNSEFNVKHTPFDLGIFYQLLKAMDGYFILPSVNLADVPPDCLEGCKDDGWRFTDCVSDLLNPWELPNMPNIGEDAWRFHLGMAVDRGFVACFTPEDRRIEIFDSGSQKSTYQMFSEDPAVSSLLRPARLTYLGKEFVDNYGNSKVKEKAIDVFGRHGISAAIEFITKAATSGLLA